jgi:hypothetical protein
MNPCARIRPSSGRHYSLPQIAGGEEEEKMRRPGKPGLRLGQEDTDLLTHIGRFVRS